MGTDPRVTRREYLVGFGTSTLGALAGCSERSDPPPQTSTRSPIETRQPTKTPSRTEKQTNSIEETATPVQWELDPLEQDKLVGAYYYAWYWGEEGYAINRGRPWLEHTPFTPELGQYDSRDPTVINQHIKWALENGVNWFIVNTGYPGGPIMTNIKETFLQAELSDYINFSLGIGLDQGPVTDENGQHIADHPDNIAHYKRYFEAYADFFEHPNYVRNNGRPFLFDFSTPSLTGDVAGALEELKDSIDDDPYIVSNMPGFWTPPAVNPENRLTPEEVFEAYDGVRKYAALPPTDEAEENYPAHLAAQTEYWRFLSDHYDAGFIPTVMPGMNDQQINWVDRERTHHDIMDLSSEEFREVCDRALDYIDPDLNAVIITSWNEFPEGTTIEPAEEYGHQRLDIVRQELGEQRPDPIPIDEYHLLELDFNQTVTPGEGPGGRQLAFFLETVGLADTDDTIRSYDVGILRGEPPFVEGAYSRGTHGEHTGRWLGGPTERAAMYVHPDAKPATEISLTGRAISPGEIAAEVSINGNQTDRIEFDSQGDAVYGASLLK